MFFTFLCNTRGIEGRYNKAKYYKVREGPHGELRWAATLGDDKPG